MSHVCLYYDDICPSVCTTMMSVRLSPVCLYHLVYCRFEHVQVQILHWHMSLAAAHACLHLGACIPKARYMHTYTHEHTEVLCASWTAPWFDLNIDMCVTIYIQKAWSAPKYLITQGRAWKHIHTMAPHISFMTISSRVMIRHPKARPLQQLTRCCTSSARAAAQTMQQLLKWVQIRPKLRPWCRHAYLCVEHLLVAVVIQTGLLQVCAPLEDQKGCFDHFSQRRRSQNGSQRYLSKAFICVCI